MAAAGALCLLGLLVCIVVGHAAWRGWLGAAFLCAMAPSGAVGLVMAMRLTPGAWAREATPFLAAEARILPLAAAAFVPVLIWLGSIYSWVGQKETTAFRAAWLSAPAFVATTVIWFLVLAVLWRLLSRRESGPWVACVGLVLFLAIGTFAATDWLQSLDPAFRSSGFGLYAIAMQMLAALALAIVIGLTSPARMQRQGVLGGILLTLVLFWAYLAYMPYFISWSADVPSAAVWYLKRGRGVWAAVAILVAVCRFVPMFLLLFGKVRNDRRWLLGVASAVLFASIPETAWIVLPAAPGAPRADAWTALAFVLSAVGLMGLGWSLAKAGAPTSEAAA